MFPLLPEPTFRAASTLPSFSSQTGRPLVKLR